MKEDTFASRVKAFNRSLDFRVPLPAGISVMNPFAEEGGVALQCADAFYDKYYADNRPRTAILGINPGRHGAALTGVPFTDFKRLAGVCGISAQGRTSHEPSSEFVYAVVAAMGGPSAFYGQFYINSVCPLGFVTEKGKGVVNYNYYDHKTLCTLSEPFIVATLRRQIALGLATNKAFIMGKKNHEVFAQINEAHHFFDSLIELPHPRFIVQYRRKHMEEFVDLYARAMAGS